LQPAVFRLRRDDDERYRLFLRRLPFRRLVAARCRRARQRGDERMTEARWSDQRAEQRAEPQTEPRRLLFTRNLRGTSGRYMTPLPSSLVERAEPDELGRHMRLVERYQRASEHVRELTAALEAARVDDEHEARRAALVGEDLPAPKVPELTRELDDAERELGLLAEALPQSAQALLDDVSEHVPEARAAALASGRGAIEALLDELDRVEAELERSAAALVEARWLAGLVERGEAAPFAHSGGGGRELRQVRGLLGELRGLLAGVLEETSEPAPLTTGGEPFWSEAHRVRPRTAQAEQPAGDEEADSTS
jgi:hypothetical protein